MQLQNQEEYYEYLKHDQGQNEIIELIHMGKAFFIKDLVTNKLVHYDSKVHSKKPDNRKEYR